MDKENELWKFCSCSPQKSQQFNLIFSGSPYRRLGQGRLDKHPERAMQMQSLAPIPDYRHYSPPPSNCLCNAFYRHLSSRSATGAEINGTGPDGCLPELDMFPCCNVMCLWYMCFCAEVVFFSVLRLYSKWSIVWGLKFFFFSPLSPHVKAVFF